MNNLAVAVAGLTLMAALGLFLHARTDPIEIGHSARQPVVQSSSVTLSPAVAVPRVAVTPAHAALPQSPARKQALAQELRRADREMQPGGFGDLCFDQMRAIFCPIVNQIPVAREVVGQLALLGGFSCPTGSVVEGN